MLCHSVLPYSNWERPTVCRSESMAAIKCEVQSAVFSLARTPKHYQTDHSTGATHDLGNGLRGFAVWRITTPLPVGYPPPTAPGAIELKAYPSVRRAEVSGSARPDLASNMRVLATLRRALAEMDRLEPVAWASRR